MMRDALGRKLPALKPTPITHPDYAARRTAEIIAEVDVAFNPLWDAVNERLAAASRNASRAFDGAGQ